jgi:hypothetical protein
LHDAARALLDRLGTTFDVERSDGYGLDGELESNELAGPGVRLVPRDAGAAPIVVAFTSFPGLRVRFGRWCMSAFPFCGCDACDETAEREIERLEQTVADVTAGRFREAIRLAGRAAYLSHELWSPGGNSRGEGTIERSRARELLAASDQASYEWAAWPRR